MLRFSTEHPCPSRRPARLCFPDQAQFNPASYLVALAKAVEARGGRIFEHSRATSFDQDDGWRVGTAHGTVRAAQVVIATNMTVKSPRRLCQPHAAPQPCGHGIPAQGSSGGRWHVHQHRRSDALDPDGQGSGRAFADHARANASTRARMVMWPAASVSWSIGPEANLPVGEVGLALVQRGL